MAKEFEANYGDVKPQAGGGFTVLPAGIKVLAEVVKAEPGMSENNNAFVKVDWKVVGGEYDGKEIRYQNVTFLPKTHKFAGIALHTLRCLNQPHEGSFKVKPSEWVGEKAYITLGVEEGPKGQRNKVVRVDPYEPEGEDAGGKSEPESKPETKAKGKLWPEGTSPDAECEVCERKFKDHGKVKHEFSEKVPF